MAWSGGRPISYLPAVSATGWTIFNLTSPSGQGDTFAGVGTRIIAVSSSTGSDSNHGTIALPYATLAKGIANIRNNSSDWLLLLAGDTWTNEDFTTFTQNGSAWNESGSILNGSGILSGNILISTYSGTDFVPGTSIPGIGRAFIKTGATESFILNTDNLNRGDKVAWVSLDVRSYTRDPNDPAFNLASSQANDVDGFHYRTNTTKQLIEGCQFQFFTKNIIFEMRDNALGTNILSGSIIYLIRNIICNAYSCTATNSQGCYVEYADLGVARENVVDHNGWNASVAGATRADRTFFDHGFYWQATNNTVTCLNNIVSQTLAEGLQQRPGGECYNNFCTLNGSSGIEFAGGQISGTNEPGSSTVKSVCHFNLITEGVDINPSLPRMFGIDVYDNTNPNGFNPSVSVNDNLVIHGGPSAQPFGHGIDWTPFIAHSNYVGQRNIVYDWDNNIHQGLINEAGSNVTLSNNVDDAQGLNNQSAPEPFPSPSLNTSNYMTSVGGSPATTLGFIALARTNSKASWDKRWTANPLYNYIASNGYGLAKVPVV